MHSLSTLLLASAAALAPSVALGVSESSESCASGNATSPWSGGRRHAKHFGQHGQRGKHGSGNWSHRWNSTDLFPSGTPAPPAFSTVAGAASSASNAMPAASSQRSSKTSVSSHATKASSSSDAQLFVTSTTNRASTVQATKAAWSTAHSWSSVQAAPSTVVAMTQAAAATSATASSSGSTSSVAKVALDTHNAARAIHNATALAWSDKLADAAKAWTQNCVWGHGGGAALGAGENLAMSTANVDYMKNGIQSWINEEKQYDYDEPGFKNTTGHFTQLVWKANTQVGCAQHYCDGFGTFVACEYLPGGNMVGGNFFADNVQAPIN
ncbi:hypothetical protein JCM11641_001514 [Rhodosporidiobolus odoratus]